MPVIAKGIFNSLPERTTSNIAMISTIVVKMRSRKKGLETIALFFYNINKAIEAKTTKNQWKSQIPAEKHDFVDLFDKKLAGELPPHRF